MVETENAALRDEGDDSVRAQRNAGRQAFGSGFTSLMMLVILTWQGIEISKYSESFPASVFSGKHVTMNATCSSLFWVTNWSLFLTVFMVVLDATITFLAFQRMGVFGDISKIGDCLLGIASFSKLVIAFLGIIMVCFSVDTSEAEACSSLYRCAWWCFLGFALLPFALACCLCCLFGVAASQGNTFQDNGDAGNALSVAGGRPIYGSAMAQPQPQPSDTDFKPFSGSGQRLGDDEQGASASSV